LLKRQTTAPGKERLQMLYWLKSGQLKTRQAIAARLDRAESTIIVGCKSMSKEV
ncbi:MAG: hypothetical protein HC851_24470, partial [Acaryochloris sp. RU_4_1]|nr:hypothetical protein [Acaryochloris sp. RU_4_1]